MRQVLEDPEGTKSGNLVAAGLLVHHNSRTGKTCPSVRTLADLTGLSLESVIQGRRDLEARGHLQHVARRSWDHTADRMSHLYRLVLKVPVAANDDPGRGVAVDSEEAARVFGPVAQGCSDPPNRGVPPARTELREDTEQKTTDRPGDSAALLEPAELAELPETPPIPEDASTGECADTRPLHEITGLPPETTRVRVDLLSRRIQQLAGPPGYRHHNAVAHTIQAIRRSGLPAVEALADRLAPQRGNLAAHRIRYFLEGLPGAGTAPQPAPKPTDLSDLPPTLVNQARRILAEAMNNKESGNHTAILAVTRAIRAAGGGDPIWPDTPAMLRGIVQALTAGTLQPECEAA